MHGHFHDASARRFDPTGTGDIRSRFRVDMSRRWAQLRNLAREAIVGPSDALGLGLRTVRSIRADPVREFQTWLDAALQQVVLSNQGEWTRHYLEEAAARARSRAYAQIPAQPGGTIEHTQPVVAASAAVELQGVVEATSQRVLRVVAQGLLAKQSAPTIAREVATTVWKVGRARSMGLVEMSVSSAFNHASLDTFKALGLKRVGIEAEHMLPGTRVVRVVRDARRKRTIQVVEVLTAGDDLVCQQCQDISDDGPYPIDEARDLIPAHPNCRCAFVPFFDKRFAGREA
jgi:hypothetical protein